MAQTKQNLYGFACPVRGCKQKNNRRFNTALSLALHISAKHGDDELQKRLRTSKSSRTTGKGL